MMSGLLGPKGQPIGEYLTQQSFANKKAPPPKTGAAFGAWAGRDFEFAQLPGGGIVQFDLSKLTISDYRNMRDHYQVNASLAVFHAASVRLAHRVRGQEDRRVLRGGVDSQLDSAESIHGDS